MRMHTCSEVIGFTRELEDTSARFYEGLSQKFDEREEAFLSFVKENKKYSADVQRAYYGVISDAIEGCFAFNVEADDYALETALAEKAGYADAVSQAVRMEETLVRFYTDAAEQSQALMADVPRAFMLISRKRGERIVKLRSL